MMLSLKQLIWMQIYTKISKKSRFGAPTELNYAAHGGFFICPLHWTNERIPTTKDLIKRLHDDIAFKINCSFLVSDASFGVCLLSTGNTINRIKYFRRNPEKIVHQAIKEGYIIDDTIAIATFWSPWSGSCKGRKKTIWT